MEQYTKRNGYVPDDKNKDKEKKPKRPGFHFDYEDGHFDLSMDGKITKKVLWWLAVTATLVGIAAKIVETILEHFDK